MPVIKPEVTEHRFHTLRCPDGHFTSAQVPDEVPQDGYGPRFKEATVYFSGVAHLSKTQVSAVIEDLLGALISAAQVCSIELERACNTSLRASRLS